MMEQLIHIITLNSFGVGIGVDASNVSLYGSTEFGKIKKGFASIVEYLNCGAMLQLYERKPKIAIYINVHNDTVLEMLTLKSSQRKHLDNIFFGLNISNYFMDCVRNDKMWHLFAGDTCVEHKGNIVYLNDYYGDEYVDI